MDKCIPKVYEEFLKVCNGGRFGSIDLWSSEIFLDNQYRIINIEGESNNCFCIGQVLYEPIVIKLDTEKKYIITTTRYL